METLQQQTHAQRQAYGLRQPAPAAQLASEPAAPAAEALKQQVIRGFEDKVFTFLRTVLRFFDKLMVYEDLCVCFFESGPLNMYMLNGVLGKSPKVTQSEAFQNKVADACKAILILMLNNR